MRAVGAAALLLVFLVGPVRGQAGASTGLMGQVTDASGAAVPGVAVTLTHVDTGRVRTVTTNASGDWEARFLSPGTFRVTFELTGFKTLRREGITVSTAEMASVNVALEIGTLAEAIDVIANAGMVSSGSMTVQRTLDQKELDVAADVGAGTSRSCWSSSRASRPTSASCCRTTTRRSRRA